ncbi:electron transfer flavoprotein subunit alpha/FixB family protein [Gemmatimonadota bacterium Y43]|uniref:electron transfer flavoprotein subunit alpha/FixB family protein n=1 Tax=Gaopeijia maritima TaxID=3119007 RepID=UPI00328DAE35
MGDVLAFAEQRDGVVRGVTHEVVSTAAALASELGGECHALAIGGEGLSGSVGALGGFGAARVKVAADGALAGYAAEAWAAIVVEAVRAGSYAAVLFPASAVGRDLAPRVAALLDVPMASDVVEVSGAGGAVVVRRPVYSGKAFARLRMDASPAVVTLRPNVFPAQERSAAGAVEEMAVSVDPSSWKARVVEFKTASAGSLDVSEASVVVSGGRGMKDPENWALLENLRDALGSDVAALGASRAVVDAGWRPHGEQVGQTGKTVSPKLYFAVGISGAIQHLAGMRSSGTIVAVNKDPDAPIFGVADYGIVGDLFEVLPALTDHVKALKAGG